jgi:uncharacterized protein DUF4384
MAKFWLAAVTVLFSWSASAGVQAGQETLTAREIFYNAKAPASPPAANPQRATTAPAKSKALGTVKSAAKEKESPASGTTVGTAGTAVANAADQAAPTVRVQTVSYSPLGLRYSLLRRVGPGQYAEINPDTTFRSGEGLRVSVESNDPAYLYIVARGTSGTWTVLFPNAAINKGDNRIEPRNRYEIPAGGQFTFDQQPGTERVFVILSRTQESDLEGLIYSLDRTQSPARSAPAPPVKTIVLNIPAIPDALVGRIREQLVSRDLVFEKVDDVTSDRKEKAVYVVNATGAADSRVLADLSLRHQ